MENKVDILKEFLNNDDNYDLLLELNKRYNEKKNKKNQFKVIFKEIENQIDTNGVDKTSEILILLKGHNKSDYFSEKLLEYLEEIYTDVYFRHLGLGSSKIIINSVVVLRIIGFTNIESCYPKLHGNLYNSVIFDDNYDLNMLKPMVRKPYNSFTTIK